MPEQLSYVWLILLVAGLILCCLKDQTTKRMGKSVVCFAFLLFNLGVVFDNVTTYMNISDVWKWLPTVICIGTMIILLLFIWKLCSVKIRWMITLFFTVGMVVLTAVTALTGTYNGSFLDELGRVLEPSTHIMSSIVTIVVFLCSRKNIIAAKIGKSLICAFLLLTVWGISYEVVAYYFQNLFFIWQWLALIPCIGSFVICLLFIWKPLNVKARRIVAISLAGAVVLLFGSLIGYRMYHKSIPTVGEWRYSEWNYPSYTLNGQEIYLRDYEPFRQNTRAKSLDESSTFRLQDNLPRIDGATALYPLYAAFVRAGYPEAEYDVYDRNSSVICTTTSGAFDNLIDGKADVIFLMDVSEKQWETAHELGLELKLTPIGCEAFVFFVNSRNSASNLSLENIQDIYSGKITNWREVGGRNNAIRAYQRSSNSGSQTALENIMDGIPIMEPLKEDIYDFMMGMYQAVADYKNYKNALGYSFLFYINEMIAENKVKFLSINGVEPTKSNIANGTYPFANDFYAVTVVREPETEKDTERISNTEKLINWILSPQGQYLVEKTGYVPIS